MFLLCHMRRQVGDLQAQVSELEMALRQCHTDLSKSQAAEQELQQLLQRLWRKHSALKQNNAHQEKLRAQANQAELQHYKVAMMAQETQKGIARETGELAHIKADLQRLLHATPIAAVAPLVHAPSVAATTTATAQSFGRTSIHLRDSVHDEQRARLIRERDELVQSGIYTASDPVIVELNARIASSPRA